MKMIIRIFITALTLMGVAYLVPGIVVDNIYVALIAALVLGLFNLIIKPVLVILTLPITLLTFGLFIFIINAGIFWFVASFIDGFSVSGFLPALAGSLIVAIVSSFAHKMLK